MYTTLASGSPIPHEPNHPSRLIGRDSNNQQPQTYSFGLVFQPTFTQKDTPRRAIKNIRNSIKREAGWTAGATQEDKETETLVLPVSVELTKLLSLTDFARKYAKIFRPEVLKLDKNENSVFGDETLIQDQRLIRIS